MKTPSGQDDGVDWTSDDVLLKNSDSFFASKLYIYYYFLQEKQLEGLNAYEQRRRKEQIIAEKKRRVAEMKRAEEFAIQNRLKKQRESLFDPDAPNELLNDDEKER